MTKPIKVFYSTLSGRFYATQHYKQVKDVFVVTGKKYDVTDDIGSAIFHNQVEFINQEGK